MLEKIRTNQNEAKKKKERIQQAFSNVANVEVIPATESNLTDDNAILRVAAYCRVSTYKEVQAGSFELQMQYYKEMIEENPK